MSERSERAAVLRELLPGIDPDVIDYLLGETRPPGAHCERYRWYLENVTRPLAALMMRLRFDDVKLSRVGSYCGAGGVSILRDSYHIFKNRWSDRSLKELEVLLRVVEAERQKAEEEEREPDFEAAAAAANSLNGEEDGEPIEPFNVERAMLAIRCEKLLWRVGRLNAGMSLRESTRELRKFIRKVEGDSRKRSPEERLGLEMPRHLSPNVLFSDGRFGDGSRLIEVTLPDGRKAQRRDDGVEAIIPAFVGLTSVEQDQMIRKALEKRKKAK